MGRITIIGGGLAGSEAAWQAANMGVPVVIHEMRPVKGTAVHKTDRLAELVCSNSFRGDKLDNAVGLLKEEMRRLDSLIMRVADGVRVPAGAALAVDRHLFPAGVTEAIEAHPLITIERGEIDAIPASTSDSPVIVATGPLTSDALSADIVRFVGRDQLAFFDAISPIVLAETIDMSRVFRQSRWGRSVKGTATISTVPSPPTSTAVFTTPSWPPSKSRATTSTTRSSSKAACRSRSWPRAASTRCGSGP
jgi:methylenetetrahydrofolate--tRNA-(uracil-5-)-methyltransferase